MIKMKRALIVAILAFAVVASARQPKYFLMRSAVQEDFTGAIVDTFAYTDTSVSVLQQCFAADSVFFEWHRYTSCTDKSDSIIVRLLAMDYLGNMSLIDTLCIIDSTRVDTAWIGSQLTRQRTVLVEISKQASTAYDTFYLYYEPLDR